MHVYSRACTPGLLMWLFIHHPVDKARPLFRVCWKVTGASEIVAPQANRMFAKHGSPCPKLQAQQCLLHRLLPCYVAFCRHNPNL
jgi:hypothetical protein